MKFQGTVELGGKTATGVQIPDDVVEALGGGKRAAVRITIGGHSYPTTIATMGGRFLVPLSAENRTAAGVVAGDVVEVEIVVDAAPREVTIPADLAAALAQNVQARQFFDTLAFTHRKEWVRWIEDSKKPETRATRLSRTIDGLAAGKRTH